VQQASFSTPRFLLVGVDVCLVTVCPRSVDPLPVGLPSLYLAVGSLEPGSEPS